MFEGMSESELDAYWKGVEAEQDRIVQIMERKKSQYVQFTKRRPNRPGVDTFHTIARTYQTVIALIKGEVNEYTNF